MTDHAEKIYKALRDTIIKYLEQNEGVEPDDIYAAFCKGQLHHIKFTIDDMLTGHLEKFNQIILKSLAGTIEEKETVQ